jgi:hypothetical protein
MGKTPGNGVRVDPPAAPQVASQLPCITVVDVRCSSNQDRLPETLGEAVVQAEAQGYRHYNTVVAGPDRYLLFCRRV